MAKEKAVKSVAADSTAKHDPSCGVGQHRKNDFSTQPMEES